MIWKPIPTYEGYEVSEYGQVRSRRGLLYQQNHKGYLKVQLHKNGKPSLFRVHRLVCEVFNGPPNSKKLVVEHLDHDKTNNYYKNLQWVSQAENIARSVADKKQAFGVRIGNAKLDDASVKTIRSAPYYYGYARDLSILYGVSPQTITAIRRGTTWRHV